MKDRIKIKLLKALRDGFLNYDDLLKVLTFRTKRQLTGFMDAVNELYSEDKVMPVSIGQEKGLILRK